MGTQIFFCFISFQFVVCDTGDYAVHSMDPDVLVEWDLIEQVVCICNTLQIAGFSLSFKVDSYDVNIGDLVPECCRQFQAFTLSLNLISPKSRRLKPSSIQLPALNEQ